MTEHTAGPWSITPACEIVGGAANTKGQYDYLVAEVNMLNPLSEYEANARLIAASPRLLEALEAIRAKADLMMEVRDGSVIWADWQTVRGYASTAIAAAKRQ